MTCIEVSIVSRLCFLACFYESHTFPHQSLLLSTTVLNDTLITATPEQSVANICAK